MKTLNYKLIVSDYDGTLVNADGTVSEQNIKAINEYMAAGGIFAISTGRLPGLILPQARRLGLRGLLCCCNGTVILDIESGEVLFEERLSLNTTLAACRKMEELGLHIHAFDLWDYYSNMDDEVLRLYEKIAGAKAKCVTDKPLSQFLSEKQLCAYKFLALVKPEDSEKTIAQLTAANLPDCSITKSMDFLVEVVNSRITKGSSIEFLSRHFGVESQKVIAIGDNFNDVPMLERAGLGIAVNNAEQALKSLAGYVCDRTNEQGAIAEIIEKFGFM